MLTLFIVPIMYEWLAPKEISEPAKIEQKPRPNKKAGPGKKPAEQKPAASPAN